MTPATRLEMEIDQEIFKQRLRSWLEEHRITQKELGVKLGVTHGTVRNWMGTKVPIGENSRKAILSLMQHPEVFDKKESQGGEVALVSITVVDPNLNMWRASSQAFHVTFNYSSPASPEELQLFAKWSTPIIVEAIKTELKKLKPEELNKLAAGQKESHDPISASERAYMDHEDADYEFMDDAITIQLPILSNRINPVFLRLAAKVKQMRPDDFIADALNAVATSEFGEELTKFLEEDDVYMEDLPKQAQPPQPKPEDDTPF